MRSSCKTIIIVFSKVRFKYFDLFSLLVESVIKHAQIF